MNIEESTDILKNIIADEVIGTYCIEIQKEGINCSENCKDEDCYLIQAIETVLNELDKKEEEIKDAIKQLEEDIQYSANPLSIDNSKFAIKILKNILGDEEENK